MSEIISTIAHFLYTGFHSPSAVHHEGQPSLYDKAIKTDDDWPMGSLVKSALHFSMTSLIRRLISSSWPKSLQTDGCPTDSAYYFFTMDTLKSTAKRTLGAAPPTDAYLAWDSPGVEHPPGKDEEGTTRKIADTMIAMQKHNFDQHRHCFRATHVKTQAVVKGNLTVPSDLPEHLKQGLFAHSGTYPVIARYANEPVFLQPDTAPGPRGMGLKIFKTPTSEPRIPGHGGNKGLNTQDFLFNNAPMLELTDLNTTLDIMQTREKHFDSPTKLTAATLARTDAMKQAAPGMLPNTHIIGMPMFTQSAFRFGEYYGHMGLFPSAEAMKAREIAEKSVPSDAPPTILSDWLVEYFASHDAVYEFKIQLGTDPVHHPTEDASIVWDEKTAHWQTIGTLTFPKQEGVMKPERRTAWEEKVRLNPFKGLEAHRPLGSVNRLRGHVYAQSQRQRAELNANENVDITSADDIP